MNAKVLSNTVKNEVLRPNHELVSEILVDPGQKCEIVFIVDGEEKARGEHTPTELPKNAPENTKIRMQTFLTVQEYYQRI